MKQVIYAVCATLLLTSTPAASAAAEAEYPSLVGTFDKVCLTGGVDPAAKIAAIEADKNWIEDQAPSIDVSQMGVSKAIERNYSFAKVEGTRQWTGSIDGTPAHVVIANFSGKTRYPNLCSIVIEGANNAMPYGGDLKEAFKRFGIKGKSVDLVHYYEFAGKIGADKHPVRGEIFSRSLAGQSKQTIHIYVAY